MGDGKDEAMDVRVYTAEPEQTQPRTVVREMFRGARKSIYMAYRLAMKDIKAQYSKSVLGMFWDLLDPLVLGLIFYGLMLYRVIQPGETGIPYAIYVIYGLLIYQTFTEGVLQTIDLFKRSRGLLTHVSLPPEALIGAVVVRVAFSSIFRIAVMLIFSVVLFSYAQTNAVHSLSLPGFALFVLLYPTVILTGMAVGLALAPFNAIYNDVGRFTRIVLNPLRYISPVIWPIPVPILSVANPVAPVVENLRSLATLGHFAAPVPFVIWMVVFACMFLAAWYMFRISVPILAERA